jgi:hypothetical protein
MRHDSRASLATITLICLHLSSLIKLLIHYVTLWLIDLMSTYSSSEQNAKK